MGPFLTSFYTPSPTFIYTLKWIGIIAFGCFLYTIGYKSGYAPSLVVPSWTYEIEKEVVIEKVVEKTVFVDRTVVKWRRSKEIKPDGTIKETEEVTNDLRKTLTTEQSSQKDNVVVKEREEVRQSNATKWGVSAGRSVNQVNSYAVSRRVLGDLWLEALVNTTKDIGVNVRYEW